MEGRQRRSRARGGYWSGMDLSSHVGSTVGTPGGMTGPIPYREEKREGAPFGAASVQSSRPHWIRGPRPMARPDGKLTLCFGTWFPNSRVLSSSGGRGRATSHQMSDYVPISASSTTIQTEFRKINGCSWGWIGSGVPRVTAG